MLKVKNISKVFDGKNALTDVSFEIKNGKIVALLGENGAGKSTLLRILGGYYEADGGEVSLEEIDLSKNRTAYLQNVGYVQEVSALYNEMTVYDFLNFVAGIREVTTDKIADRIKETVEMLQLKEVLTQKNETLSKGFKKRVELAAVLLSEPKMLLLDEPTEGLDPNQKATIRKIIKKYAKNHTVIISTHTLEDVEALAGSVLLLHRGKLLFDCDLSTFKKNAKDDLLASFQKVTAD